jgi:Zn-dependent peptidase ImmA (M78 family)
MPTDLHDQGDGRRLVALRDLFGLRLADLSEALGVGSPFLSRVEQGHKPLPEEVMLRAAATYDLPLSFFTVAPSQMDGAIQTFKKSSKATIRDEKRVTRQHKEATRLFQTTSERSGYRPVAFPSSDDLDEEDVEAVALEIRTHLGLDQYEPVLNAIRSVERRGVGVIDNLDDLERARGDHAGISMPHRESKRPLIAIVTPLESAEKRFTVMHELGHLVLDADIASPVMRRRDAVEKRADRFARAVLLPAPAMKDNISPSLNLHGYLRIKAEFGVRVDMIVKRGEELGLLDARRAKSLYIQRSSAGWGKKEPVEVNDERPVLLKQSLIKAYGSEPADASAADVGVASRWVRRWAYLPAKDDAITEASVIDLSAMRVARR